ncbi:class I SAM-dependent methyltransferase [Bacillus suaedaesalsae]|uniref:Class I SAM-dependent methyltransferase n=1 Tax=Bacillus suaedaesalsae TaxID=2810349 RepID=A0ABS2DFX9_9BACI|nr:class I SAM-dependent methyltransferase [Bacillus suaedaesalsae]MBM6617373.1 class I SAM-dependent methyltransferase [Bacillus suaedaesalsae]
MGQTNIIEVNKNCWNKVAHHFHGVEALPEYGPFTETEDELHLFDEIKGKKVLEIGCGSGHSLKYMSDRHASELWGIDLSQSQIETAKSTLIGLNTNLICSPMEEECGIPKEYFDMAFSIYALGWSTDLSKTTTLIYSYLKQGGSFIFSWEHPFYSSLTSRNEELILSREYQKEDMWEIPSFKGESVQAIIPRRKLSTFLNELIRVGFKIEKLIEGEVSSKYDNEIGEISERYYSLYKTRLVPSTFIIKARK